MDSNFNFLCARPHDDDDDDDDDNDEYDNFYGAITQHMPLQGRLDKNPSHVRDMISRSSLFLVWT